MAAFGGPLSSVLEYHAYCVSAFRTHERADSIALLQLTSAVHGTVYHDSMQHAPEGVFTHALPLCVLAYSFGRHDERLFLFVGSAVEKRGRTVLYGVHIAFIFASSRDNAFPHLIASSLRHVFRQVFTADLPS